MEGLQAVFKLLCYGELGMLGLKDAYFAIPIEEGHYFRFQWMANIFEFTCLPFCLKSTHGLSSRSPNQLLLTFPTGPYSNTQF